MTNEIKQRDFALDGALAIIKLKRDYTLADESERAEIFHSLADQMAIVMCQRQEALEQMRLLNKSVNKLAEKMDVQL